ncbi:hypothetical protein G6F46_000320 [Rhizopus delemar]|nr:hypothetical protein G6F43_004179 [Rhizopus delemar]KAG1551834.1 hypothetical protein G6F51_001601 [Rhizopus arrhizus]KAG1466007.1 hypothetical protein G6F55_000762 [Rhizopus delemar]KAG1505408.1 hypothetical protein G6F54_000336 [Rhizopus delemar]KAG1518836.1 hypothetical protein G6F53_000273 [Rhizopus delemar]
MSTATFQHDFEPCLARLGTTPEEVYALDDIETLRQLIIKKERERQAIANDLEVAARIGLVISETNEAIQIKLEHLERENRMFQEELRSRPTYHVKNDNEETNDEEERIFLQQELDQARRELSKFRKEMDGLSAQLNDMASEMVDSRSKVGVYAKRLAEVEQKLAATRDVNANLQSLLDKALTSQKQSSSNTSHLVKNIQIDLERVVQENEQLRVRIAELEQQQVENEEKIAAMVIQAQEYASRLEQAQNTIHNLSEPKLLEDDELLSFHSGFHPLSVSSQEGAKETEITKGPVFSAEFRQEMQKEIERNLNLRNEIRHRIITADNSISSDKKKSVEGLKYLATERESAGLASLSTSTSSSTNSSILSTVMKKDIMHTSTQHHPQEEEQNTPKAPMLRPASFLTGFGGFGSDGLNMGGNFITRGMPPRTFSSVGSRNNEPSISTRFFQRLTSRLEDYEKKTWNTSS